LPRSIRARASGERGTGDGRPTRIARATSCRSAAVFSKLDSGIRSGAVRAPSPSESVWVVWRPDCAKTAGVAGNTPPAATISARALGSANVVLPSPPAIEPSTLKRCWFSAMGSVCPLHGSQPSGAAAPSKRAASPTMGRVTT
jgi:hypothetical protein